MSKLIEEEIERDGEQEKKMKKKREMDYREKNGRREKSKRHPMHTTSQWQSTHNNWSWLHYDISITE